MAQTKVCSSYDGDDSGRFHDHRYVIGQEMRWWKENAPKYKNWFDESVIKIENGFLECCYSECKNCDSNDIFAVICFQDKTITSVEKIGRINDWPDEFSK
ncbi:MAG: hypothetical protein KIT34_00525 [Cyanobacteria bacterium TGS_CYA1]|nr:hypothetical protein [Cyanobacteria bacterium TGS_CYA1]